MKIVFSPVVILCGLTGLKAPTVTHSQNDHGLDFYFCLACSCEVLALATLQVIINSLVYVQHINTGFWDPSHCDTACQDEYYDPICVSYTCDQLLSIPPSCLTPNLTCGLRELNIGFHLPCKHSCHGGKKS